MQASGDGNFKKVSVYISVPDQLTHPKGGEKNIWKGDILGLISNTYLCVCTMYFYRYSFSSCSLYKPIIYLFFPQWLSFFQL